MMMMPVTTMTVTMKMMTVTMMMMTVTMMITVTMMMITVTMMVMTVTMMMTVQFMMLMNDDKENVCYNVKIMFHHLATPIDLNCLVFNRHRHQIDHECPSLPVKPVELTAEERLKAITGSSAFENSLQQSYAKSLYYWPEHSQ